MAKKELIALLNKHQSKISFYKNELLKWNKKINLIAKSTETNLFERHILDSAQLITYLPNKETKIADLGSGAGLPGIVLSILGYSNISLIEKDKNKCAFLKHIKRQLRLNVEIKNQEIQILTKNVPRGTSQEYKYECIVARALTAIDNLLEYAQDLLTDQGFLLLLKGENYKEELTFAQKRWKINYRVHSSITDKRSVVIKITDFI